MIFLTIKKISLNRRKSKHQKWKRIKKPHKPTVNKIPLLNICSKISLRVKNNLFKWRKHNIRARVLYFDVTEIFNNFRNISQNIDLKILPSFVISISWLNIIDNISMDEIWKNLLFVKFIDYFWRRDFNRWPSLFDLYWDFRFLTT